MNQYFPVILGVLLTGLGAVVLNLFNDLESIKERQVIGSMYIEKINLLEEELKEDSRKIRILEDKIQIHIISSDCYEVDHE